MSAAQKIPFLSAMLMSVNIMVGGGILSGPGPMAGVAGSWSFLGWLIVALTLLPVVLSITRMAEIFPSDSGFAGYCEQGLGRYIGHMGGWTYFIGYAFAAASILSVYRITLLKIWPNATWLENPFVFFAGLALILVILNNLKVTVVASIQSYLTVIKLLPVLIAIILLPFFLNNDLAFSMEELQALPNSLTYAMFGFLGFEFCASLINDIEGGAPQARKAILGGFLTVAAIYIAFHFSLLNIMGSEGLATMLANGYPTFVAKKFGMLGVALGMLIPLTTVITYFNSSNGLLTLDSTVLGSIADSEKIYMNNWLGMRNSNGRPWIAVAIAGLLVFALAALIPDFKNLFAVTNLAVTSVFFLANISLWIADHNANAFNRMVNGLAIIILSCLLVYDFLDAGATWTIRLQNVGMLFIAKLIGMILYKPKPKTLVEKTQDIIDKIN